MMKLLTCAVAVILFAGCAGKDGDAGPTGPQGPAGPGSRIVYTSTEAIPTNELFLVNVPEITLADMPLVSVYVRLNGNSLWYELPTYFENYPNFGQICFFTEGRVSFSQCRDFYYKIVIVK